jgi:hypothetical protein
MKTLKLILISVCSFLTLTLSAQFKVLTDGNSKLGDNKWLTLTPLQTQAGILFYETGSSTSSTIQYGAKMYYDGATDRFHIVTRENNSDNYGISISRSTGNVVIGSSSPTSQKLYVAGNTCFTPIMAGELYIDDYMGITTIWPRISNNTYLGRSTNYFYKTYTNIIYRNTEYSLSDLSTKKNVKKIDNALGTILKLRGVIYDYNEKAFQNTSLTKMPKLLEENKNRIGFIAQEVQEVLPQLVEYDDSTDLNYLNYEGIIPILVEAIKELQSEVEKLNSEMKSKSDNQNLKSATDISADIILSDRKSNNAILYQNAPNPFTENTEIKYYLPEEIKFASLYIYNLQGIQIKSIVLHNRGDGKEKIHGSELQAGMYIYALIADGKEIDTKRMILTD